MRTRRIRAEDARRRLAISLVFHGLNHAALGGRPPPRDYENYGALRLSMGTNLITFFVQNVNCRYL